MLAKQKGNGEQDRNRNQHTDPTQNHSFDVPKRSANMGAYPAACCGHGMLIGRRIVTTSDWGEHSVKQIPSEMVVKEGCDVSQP